MWYYIKGDPDNPEGVKAKIKEITGFEKLGDFHYKLPNNYFLITKDKLWCGVMTNSIIREFIESHAEEVKPIETPKCEFKINDWVYYRGGIFPITNIELRTSEHAQERKGYYLLELGYEQLVGENYVDKCDPYEIFGYKY